MQIFYKALVVNNDSKNGDRRIQVRVLGVHPFESEADYPNVPDEVLPWARIAPSISSGSFSGECFKVPKNGEWVWVFFEDEGFQQPIYFAYVSADTDVDSEFKPNENEITTNRYNGQKTVVTEKYQSNTTNGNGLLLSTNENKAMLTNNTIATILAGHDMKSYVGKDETPQSMVYGNRLLDCFQSTLSILKNNLEDLSDRIGGVGDGNANNNIVSLEDTMGIVTAINSIPNKIKAGGNLGIDANKLIDDMKKLNEKNENKYNEDMVKWQKGELETEPEKPTLIDVNDIKNKLENLDFSIDIDMTGTKLEIYKSIGMAPSNIVNPLTGQWMGETPYTAKLNAIFLKIYMAIDNLYTMILYKKEPKDVNGIAPDKKWRDNLITDYPEPEGNGNEYDCINDVRNNLKYALNNNALFYPEQQDLNQLIIDEYDNGTLPTVSSDGNMPTNSNFNSIKCKKMKPENVKYIVVHCSDSDFGDVDLINQWHQQRGWCKIGYHYVITNGCKTKKDYVNNGNQPLPNSEIQKGRMDDEQGAHTQGYNHKSIGICLIGTNNFSMIQKTTAAGLIDTLRKKYNIPKENILRHCDTPQAHGKTCPNMNDIQWKAFIALLN